MLLYKKTWTRQPQQCVAPSRKMMRMGMVALFDQRTLTELISGAKAVNNTGTPVVSRLGRGYDYSGTANTEYSHQPQFAVTDALSIVAVVEIDALTNYGAIIQKAESTTTQTPYELRLGVGASDSRIEIVRASASFREYRGASNVLSAGYAGPLVATIKTGALEAISGRIFVAGFEQDLTNDAGSGVGAATDSGVSPVRIGRRKDGVTQLDGRVFCVALFNRELAHEQARAIVANPWQLFEPRRIWVPQSAASLPTLSLSTYKPGTLSASGWTPRITAT